VVLLRRMNQLLGSREHHPANALITSSDCTTSARRGKILWVRKSWTSTSWSEQQSSTIIMR